MPGCSEDFILSFIVLDETLTVSQSVSLFAWRKSTLGLSEKGRSGGVRREQVMCGYRKDKLRLYHLLYTSSLQFHIIKACV